MDKQYVGSKIFDKIETDERVTSDLNYCLYCNVTSHGNDGSFNDTGYRITLDCCNGNSIKQCPSCKRIYILKDPIEQPFGLNS